MSARRSVLVAAAIAALFIVASIASTPASVHAQTPPAATPTPATPPPGPPPPPPAPPVVLQPGDILWTFAQEPPLFDGRVAQAIATLMTDRMPASTGARVVFVTEEGPGRIVPGGISRLDQVPLLLRAAGFGSTPPFIQVGQCKVWAGPAQAGVDPKAVAAALGTALQQALASLGVQPAAPTKVDAQCGVAVNASDAHLLVWVNGDPRPPVVPRRNDPTFLSWQGFVPFPSGPASAGGVRPAATGNANIAPAGAATGSPFEASAAIALLVACALVAGGRVATAQRKRSRA